MSRISAWVADVVEVIRHDSWTLSIRVVRRLKGTGTASPASSGSASQSMLSRASRGGVPVFRRPSGRPSVSRRRPRSVAGASPSRPAGVVSRPTWMTPRRKVPAVSTTAPDRNSRPSWQATPQAPPSWSSSRSSTAASITCSPGVADSSPVMAARYSERSACARGPCTAGPLDRFSSLKWMPARSAAIPISPSSASISRTRCPLPMPPIAGLQDMAPIVSSRCVRSSVLAPVRAAAAAASQPAWPPPITITSIRSLIRIPCLACGRTRASLADAELVEHGV